MVTRNNYMLQSRAAFCCMMSKEVRAECKESAEKLSQGYGDRGTCGKIKGNKYGISFRDHRLVHRGRGKVPEELVFGAKLRCTQGSQDTYLIVNHTYKEIEGLPAACVLDRVDSDMREMRRDDLGSRFRTARNGCRMGGVSQGGGVEDYPELLVVMVNPNGSIYLTEGMYDIAMQFLSDCWQNSGCNMEVISLFDQSSPEGIMMRNIMERLLLGFDMSGIDKFRDDLLMKGTEKGYDGVLGWNVDILNQEMFSLLKEECENTKRRMEEEPSYRCRHEHRNFMYTLSDAATILSYHIVANRGLAIWSVTGGKGGLDSINKLDDLLVDPSKLAGVSGDELYEYLLKNGYDVKPLSKGSYKGIPFEEGGGFKVNWGGDRIIIE